MKRIITVILLSIIILSIHAQTIPYEKLDSISELISKLQLEVNGKIYNYGDSEFELSFPEENFKVYYHNQLATTAIYKKQAGKEILCLTENIDFSKAIGFLSSFTNKEIAEIKVYFPSGYLKTQQFENGVLTNTSQDDYLEFFRLDRDLDKTLFYYLFNLCTSMQIAKGLITKPEIINQKKDINTLKAEAFLQKYPNSLYTMQLKENIRKKEEKSEQNYLLVKSFVDSLCEVYKFKAGLTEAEFRSFNIDAAKIMKKKYLRGTKLPNDTYNCSDRPNSTYLFFNDKGKLETYEFDIVNKGSYYPWKAKDIVEISENYNKMVSFLESRIPAEFIRKGINRRKTNFITIFHPKLNVEITYTTFFNPDFLSVANYSITFYSVNR